MKKRKRQANLIKNDVSAALQHKIFVVKDVNQSTWSRNDDLSHGTTRNFQRLTMTICHTVQQETSKDSQ